MNIINEKLKRTKRINRIIQELKEELKYETDENKCRELEKEIDYLMELR